MDREHDSNPLDDDDDEKPRFAKPAQVKRITVRTGIGVLTFGLIVTMYGASRLAGGAPVYGSYGGVCHQAGLVIMFLGTITLLIGYRIPWFASLLEERVRHVAEPESGEPNTSIPAESPTMAVDHPAPSTSSNDLRWKQEPWPANFVIFGILVALLVGSTLLVLLLPSGFAAYPIILVTALSFLGCLTGMIYGTSFQRTFCVGAMITVGILFAQWCLLLLTGSSISGAWTSRRMYSPSLVEYISDIARFLGSAARTSRVYTIIMWALSLLFGITAVGLRFVLEAVNHANTPRRR